MTTVFIALVSIATAFAGSLSLGAGVGAGADLPDLVSADTADFRLGPVMYVPVRWETDAGVRFRATLSAQGGTGSDRVTWLQVIDGDDVRFYDDSHWALALVGGATVGVEVGPESVPVPIHPYLGAEGGMAWVGTFHSFGGDTQILFDPEQNDLENARNIDPFTTQWTWLTDLHAGARVPFADRSMLEIELGYSTAYVDARGLRRSAAGLDARREAYGWNPVRIGVAVVVLK